MHPSSTVAGVLVLRAWIEPPDGLRIRVTSTTDVLDGEASTWTTTSADEACEQVRRWLEDYRRAHT